MRDTSRVDVRVKTTIKNEAEGILIDQGITPAQAIETFYSQVIYSHGLPFDIKLPHLNSQPVAIGKMSRASIDLHIARGMASLETQPVISSNEMDKDFSRKSRHV